MLHHLYLVIYFVFFVLLINVFHWIFFFSKYAVVNFKIFLPYIFYVILWLPKFQLFIFQSPYSFPLQKCIMRSLFLSHIFYYVYQIRCDHPNFLIHCNVRRSCKFQDALVIFICIVYSSYLKLCQYVTSSKKHSVQTSYIYR
jgi:hypothetical protein